MRNTRRFQDCPVLGVGMGLRHSLLEDTLQATYLLDWVEITPENYMGKGGRSMHALERAKAIYPIVSHGVNLSIGSKDALNPRYLSKMRELFEVINPPWFSDHLCFSSIANVYFNDLMPLPRTDETVSHVTDRINAIQDYFQRPFLIENISYYFQYPEQTLSDTEFLTAILEKSDCGLLLDVNNVYVNAQNHQSDPIQYLQNIPLDRVVQIHVAGHTHYEDGIVDTHGDTVCDDVWSLLEWTLDHTAPCGVMLERDLNIPPFAELEAELLKIKALWDKTQQAFDKELRYATV